MTDWRNPATRPENDNGHVTGVTPEYGTPDIVPARPTIRRPTPKALAHERMKRERE